MDFQIPLSLDNAAGKVDLKDLAPLEVGIMLKDVADTLTAQANQIVDEKQWHAMLSFVNDFADLNEKQQAQVVHLLVRSMKRMCTLATNADVVEDTRTEYRSAVKRYAFLLASLVPIGEQLEATAADQKPAKKVGGKKDKGPKTAEKSKFDWSTVKEGVIAGMVDTLECVAVFQLWSLAAPGEDFGNLFFKTAASLLESHANMKNKSIRAAVFALFSLSVKKFQFYVRGTTCIVHLLNKYEHLPLHLAELLQCAAEQHDCPRLLGDVIREIGRMTGTEFSHDSAGARNVSTLMSELGARAPKAMMQNLSVLVTHLNGENYSLRNGVVQMVGKLLLTFPKSSKDVDAEEEERETAKKAGTVADDADADQEDGEEENSRKLKNKRDALLALLEERVNDVSSYTRSKVLQVWIELVSEDAVPLRYLPFIVQLAARRLQDKTSQVRKYAVGLLSALLKHNPFWSQLSLTSFTAELQKLGMEFKEDMEGLQQRLKAARSERAQQAKAKAKELEQNKKSKGKKQKKRNDDGSDSEADDGSDAESEQEPQDDDDAEAKDDPEAQAAVDESAPVHEDKVALMSESERVEYLQKKKKLDYCFDAVQFITAIHEAVPILCQLLGSKTQTDVEESIEFFTTAAQFSVEAANSGIRKMLLLVWSKEQGTRDAVIAAYSKLYIGEMASLKEPAKSKEAAVVAAKLIKLLDGATLAEVTSLEELLTQLAHRDMILPVVIKALWDTAGAPASSAATCASAISILSMVANAKPEILVQHVDTLVSVGFGPRSKSSDSLLARNTCIALQKLAKPTIKGDGPILSCHERISRSVSSRTLTVILDKLASLVKVDSSAAGAESSSEAVDQRWYSTAEQAIATIFMLHPQPEEACNSVIRDLAKALFCMPQSGASKKAEVAQPSTACRVSSAALSKLLFVVGHVSIKLLVYLEQVEDRMKKLRREAQNAKAASSQAAPAAAEVKAAPAKGRKKKAEEPSDIAPTAPAPSAESKIEEELAVAASQDYEIELMRDRAEKSLLCKTSLLGLFAPLVVKVCSKPAQYPNDVLQSSAVLALCKLMCLSEEFCTGQLQLLFSILKAARSPQIRANVIIALGDMAFRFPNAIEPWSDHMYDRLHDVDMSVRKNTMMVLTHLILNDMMKVKGPISEIALCVEDPETRIADLARLFFQELSGKGNSPIYNVLPDVISRLSANPEVTADSFKAVMKFLMQFIQKDKQSETLVEKLCSRFSANTDVKQWRDIAYCLSQLNYSEKAVKKLSELFRLFKDKLADADVYDSFVAVVQKCKKFAKQEMKDMVAELESKLAECHSKEVEDEASGAKAAAASRKKGGRASANKNAEQNAFDDDAAADAVEAEVKQQAASVTKKGAKGKKGKPAAAAKTKAKPAAKSRRKKKASSSEDEEEDPEEEEEDVDVEDEDNSVEADQTMTEHDAENKAPKANTKASSAKASKGGAGKSKAIVSKPIAKASGTARKTAAVVAAAPVRGSSRKGKKVAALPESDQEDIEELAISDADD